MKVITTSWDDGHIMDFRLAELLDKYNLNGTFYIPTSNNEREVMEEKDILTLANRFEIGGHTVNHTSIKGVSKVLFETEIQGCYTWLNNLIGTPPESFCFPRGIYNREAVNYARKTGFKIIRTTELLNPWIDHNSPIVHTTLQAYPHSTFTYYKHVLKRLNLKSLMLYNKTNGEANLIQLIHFYLNYINHNGGCFHLWGHSWEIEKYNLWSLLEEIFREISNISWAKYIANKDLVNYKTNIVDKDIAHIHN